MLVRLQRWDNYRHKQEHLIMQAQKFGKISLMIKDQTFGHSVVYYMNWLH